MLGCDRQRDVEEISSGRVEIKHRSELLALTMQRSLSGLMMSSAGAGKRGRHARINTASNGIAENATYLCLLRALRCTTAKYVLFVNVLWVPRNTAFLREAEQIGGHRRIVVVALCILLASMNADASMSVQHAHVKNNPEFMHRKQFVARKGGASRHSLPNMLAPGEARSPTCTLYAANRIAARGFCQQVFAQDLVSYVQRAQSSSLSLAEISFLIIMSRERRIPCARRLLSRFSAVRCPISICPAEDFTARPGRAVRVARLDM